jgi:redox-regulated HSP33 family molecular chaperone
MRTCSFEFRCDCSVDKLLPFFRSLTDEAITDLYGEDEELIINCPRCGRYFALAREDIGQDEDD